MHPGSLVSPVTRRVHPPRKQRACDTIPPYSICIGNPPRRTPMTHPLKGKTKLLNRVRRIKGQVEAIERALESEAVCADVMQQITSCRGAVSGWLRKLLEDRLASPFSTTPANK